MHNYSLNGWKYGSKNHNEVQLCRLTRSQVKGESKDMSSIQVHTKVDAVECDIASSILKFSLNYRFRYHLYLKHCHTELAGCQKETNYISFKMFSGYSQVSSNYYYGSIGNNPVYIQITLNSLKQSRCLTLQNISLVYGLKGRIDLYTSNAIAV